MTWDQMKVVFAAIQSRTDPFEIPGRSSHCLITFLADRCKVFVLPTSGTWIKESGQNWKWTSKE